MSWLDDWRPEILCLGAGGIKGLDELGAIWWFWLNGNLEKLHSYIGSSIGGIICALLAMGWLPHQILEYAIDAELFKDVSELPVTQVVHEFGIVSNKSFDDALGKKLGDMIIKKLGKIPTLLEFYEKTQKRVVFVIVSLKGEKLVYADHKSHPDMNLMTALRSTSNTPFIFGKLEHQKDFLVDGAIMDPFPVNYLDDGKTPILGIGVSDQREWNYTKMNAINYYDRIASLALKRLTDFAIANMSDACYALILPVADGAGLLKMGSRESRLEKFLAGYKNTEIHVARFPHKMKPKEKETGDPPISMDLLRTCFKTHSAQLILRAMKENPDMFEECLKEVKVEWKPPKEVIPEVPEVQKDEHREIIVHPNAPPDEEEEEILEIPREAFRPAFQPFARESRSYDFPFPMPRMGVMINVSMDPYILDRLYETILEGIGLIRLTSSSSFGLKKI